MDIDKRVNVSDMPILLEHSNNLLLNRSQSNISDAMEWLADRLNCDGMIICRYLVTETVLLGKVLNCGYPSEWLATYEDRGYYKIDPVLLLPVDRPGTYEWDTAYALSNSRIGSEFIESARDFGLAHGFATAVSRQDNFDKNSVNVTLISFIKNDRIIENYALNLCACLLPSLEVALLDAPLPSPGMLTSREMETLSWAAKGKTSWEISRLLSVSEATAKFHLSNIYKKMNVFNKTQAVICAQRLGWVL